MKSTASTRTLLLLRHAKSSWDQAGSADSERPLAPRGIRAAPLIGAEMARRGWRPDQVLCSPARRTRQTWELVAGELAAGALEPPPVRYEPALYLAAPAALLRLIRAAPPDAARLLLVGHNPGLQELAVLLAGRGEGDALARLRAKLPTGGLVVLTLDAGWGSVAAGTAALEAFVTPRDLAGDPE
jgi:phosphohistidine phosphatase